MKKLKQVKRTNTSSIFSRIIDIQNEIKGLHPLSAVNKASLEQSIAIDQLYYSSKLEGTNLTDKMIKEAIHGNGTKLSASPK